MDRDADTEREGIDDESFRSLARAPWRPAGRRGPHPGMIRWPGQPRAWMVPGGFTHAVCMHARRSAEQARRPPPPYVSALVVVVQQQRASGSRVSTYCSTVLCGRSRLGMGENRTGRTATGGRSTDDGRRPPAPAKAVSAGLQLVRLSLEPEVIERATRPRGLGEVGTWAGGPCHPHVSTARSCRPRRLFPSILLATKTI